MNTGDVVRLKVDKIFDGVLIQAGTLGTIAAVLPTMEACLVVLGHETTTRLVPNDQLDVLSALTAKPAGGKAKSAGFAQGDRVKLREDRTYDGTLYPKGSAGAVASVLVTFKACLVDFDQDSTDRVVPDVVLQPE